MIDDLTIRRLTEAASVADVIGAFYRLRRSGKDLECLCPFHEDRHMGSFKVSPAKNRWRCYSCGAGGDSIEFLMRHERLSYPEALRWIGSRYGIEVDGTDGREGKRSAPALPPTPPAVPRELPMLELPLRMVSATATKQAREADALCSWMRSLPWSGLQRERLEKVLRNYAVGHSDLYADRRPVEQGLPGWTVFWQVDERGRVRTGKMLRYHGDTGKRYKREELRYNTDWIHARLMRTGRVDAEGAEVRQCLFGLHLLGMAPGATVNIVESEKTALICTTAYGDMRRQLWMACGGLHGVRREMLEPLMRERRHIVLYPDRDGTARWEEAAAQVGYDRLHVNSRFMQQNWKPEDGEKADIADILLRLMREAAARRPALPPLEAMQRMNPALTELIERFDLVQANAG